MAKRNYSFLLAFFVLLTADIISSRIIDEKKKAEGESELEGIEVDLREINRYAEQAVEQFGSASAPGMKAIVKEIEKTTSYPSSSKLLYKIKLRVGITNCKKGSDEENCEYDEVAGYDNCEIKVFRGIDEEHPMMMKCIRVDRKKRQAEKETLNDEDPKVVKYANEGVKKFAETSTWANEPTLGRVKEAFLHKSDSSPLYEVKIQIVESTCPKGQTENCKVKPDGESNCCIVNVSVVDNKDKVELSCK